MSHKIMRLKLHEYKILFWCLFIAALTSVGILLIDGLVKKDDDLPFSIPDLNFLGSNGSAELSSIDCPCKGNISQVSYELMIIIHTNYK